MSCVSCICERLENCPVFSCIYLVDLSWIVLFFFLDILLTKTFYSLKNVLLIEKKEQQSFLDFT